MGLWLIVLVISGRSKNWRCRFFAKLYNFAHSITQDRAAAEGLVTYGLSELLQVAALRMRNRQGAALDSF